MGSVTAAKPGEGKRAKSSVEANTPTKDEASRREDGQPPRKVPRPGVGSMLASAAAAAAASAALPPSTSHRPEKKHEDDKKRAEEKRKHDDEKTKRDEDA